MGFRELEIFIIAHQHVIDIHNMTLTDLPKCEMYEEGQQIRRSIKSVKSNIVEGYGRKQYRLEYIKFLTFALALNNETIDHLENLFETKSLTNLELFKDCTERLDKLGRKLNLFRQAIEKG